MTTQAQLMRCHDQFIELIDGLVDGLYTLWLSKCLQRESDCLGGACAMLADLLTQVCLRSLLTEFIRDVDAR